MCCELVEGHLPAHRARGRPLWSEVVLAGTRREQIGIRSVRVSDAGERPSTPLSTEMGSPFAWGAPRPVRRVRAGPKHRESDRRGS